MDPTKALQIVKRARLGGRVRRIERPKGMTKANAAYRQLRAMNVAPAVARGLLVGLRNAGFIVVEEKAFATVAKIDRQIEIIIKLMRLGNSRGKK